MHKCDFCPHLCVEADIRVMGGGLLRGALWTGRAGSSAGRTHRPGLPACPPARAGRRESVRLEEFNTDGDEQLSLVWVRESSYSTQPCSGREPGGAPVWASEAAKALPQTPPRRAADTRRTAKRTRRRQGQLVHTNRRLGAGGGREGGRPSDPSARLQTQRPGQAPFLRGADQGAGG